MAVCIARAQRLKEVCESDTLVEQSEGQHCEKEVSGVIRSPCEQTRGQGLRYCYNWRGDIRDLCSELCSECTITWGSGKAFGGSGQSSVTRSGSKPAHELSSLFLILKSSFPTSKMGPERLHPPKPCHTSVTPFQKGIYTGK